MFGNKIPVQGKNILIGGRDGSESDNLKSKIKQDKHKSAKNRWDFIAGSLNDITQGGLIDHLRSNNKSNQGKTALQLGIKLIKDGMGDPLRGFNPQVVNIGCAIVEWGLLRNASIGHEDQRLVGQAHFEVWKANPVTASEYSILKARYHYKEALKHLDIAVDPRVWIEYSRVLECSGDMEESAIIVQRLLFQFEDSPEFSSYLLYAGSALKALGNFDRAGSYFFEAIGTGPPKHLSRLEMMFIVARTLEESTKDDEVPVEDGYKMVHQHLQEEGLLSDDITYDEWLHNNNTWRGIADKCAIHGCYTLAADLYGRGLFRDPVSFTKPKLWMSFAKTCFRCGKYAEAQLALKQALSIDPYDQEILAAYNTWSKMGREEEISEMNMSDTMMLQSQEKARAEAKTTPREGDEDNRPSSPVSSPSRGATSSLQVNSKIMKNDIESLVKVDDIQQLLDMIPERDIKHELAAQRLQAMIHGWRHRHMLKSGFSGNSKLLRKRYRCVASTILDKNCKCIITAKSDWAGTHTQLKFTDLDLFESKYVSIEGSKFSPPLQTESTHFQFSLQVLKVDKDEEALTILADPLSSIGMPANFEGNELPHSKNSNSNMYLIMQYFCLENGNIYRKLFKVNFYTKEEADSEDGDMKEGIYKVKQVVSISNAYSDCEDFLAYRSNIEFNGDYLMLKIENKADNTLINFFEYTSALKLEFVLPREYLTRDLYVPSLAKQLLDSFSSGVPCLKELGQMGTWGWINTKHDNQLLQGHAKKKGRSAFQLVLDSGACEYNMSMRIASIKEVITAKLTVRPNPIKGVIQVSFNLQDINKTFLGGGRDLSFRSSNTMNKDELGSKRLNALDASEGYDTMKFRKSQSIKFGDTSPLRSPLKSTPTRKLINITDDEDGDIEGQQLFADDIDSHIRRNESPLPMRSRSPDPMNAKEILSAGKPSGISRTPVRMPQVTLMLKKVPFVDDDFGSVDSFESIPKNTITTTTTTTTTAAVTGGGPKVVTSSLPSMPTKVIPKKSTSTKESKEVAGPRPTNKQIEAKEKLKEEEKSNIEVVEEIKEKVIDSSNGSASVTEEKAVRKDIIDTNAVTKVDNVALVADNKVVSDDSNNDEGKEEKKIVEDVAVVIDDNKVKEEKEEKNKEDIVVEEKKEEKKEKKKPKEEKPKASASAAAAFLAKKPEPKEEKEKTKIKEEKPKASASAAAAFLAKKPDSKGEKDKKKDASTKGKSKKDTSKSNKTKASSSSSIEEKNEMSGDTPSSPIIDDTTSKDKVLVVNSTTLSTEEKKSEEKIEQKTETSSEPIKVEEKVEKVDKIETKPIEEVNEATITPPPPTSSLKVESKVSILDEEKEVSKVVDIAPTTTTMTTATATTTATTTTTTTTDDNPTIIDDILKEKEVKRRETAMHVPHKGEDLNWAKRQLEEHSTFKNHNMRDSVKLIPLEELPASHPVRVNKEKVIAESGKKLANFAEKERIRLDAFYYLQNVGNDARNYQIRLDAVDFMTQYRHSAERQLFDKIQEALNDDYQVELKKRDRRTSRIKLTRNSTITVGLNNKKEKVNAPDVKESLNTVGIDMDQINTLAEMRERRYTQIIQKLVSVNETKQVLNRAAQLQRLMTTSTTASTLSGGLKELSLIAEESAEDKIDDVAITLDTTTSTNNIDLKNQILDDNDLEINKNNIQLIPKRFDINKADFQMMSAAALVRALHDRESRKKELNKEANFYNLDMMNSQNGTSINDIKNNSEGLDLNMQSESLTLFSEMSPKRQRAVKRNLRETDALNADIILPKMLEIGPLGTNNLPSFPVNPNVYSDGQSIHPSTLLTASGHTGYLGRAVRPISSGPLANIGANVLNKTPLNKDMLAKISVDKFIRQGYAPGGSSKYQSHWEVCVDAFFAACKNISELDRSVMNLQTLAVDMFLTRAEVVCALAECDGNRFEAIAKLRQPNYLAEVRTIAVMLRVEDAIKMAERNNNNINDDSIITTSTTSLDMTNNKNDNNKNNNNNNTQKNRRKTPEWLQSPSKRQSNREQFLEKQRKKLIVFDRSALLNSIPALIGRDAMVIHAEHLPPHISTLSQAPHMGLRHGSSTVAKRASLVSMTTSKSNGSINNDNNNNNCNSNIDIGLTTPDISAIQFGNEHTSLIGGDSVGNVPLSPMNIMNNNNNNNNNFNNLSNMNENDMKLEIKEPLNSWFTGMGPKVERGYSSRVIKSPGKPSILIRTQPQQQQQNMMMMDNNSIDDNNDNLFPLDTSINMNIDIERPTSPSHARLIGQAPFSPGKTSRPESKGLPIMRASKAVYGNSKSLRVDKNIAALVSQKDHMTVLSQRDAYKVYRADVLERSPDANKLKTYKTQLSWGK